MTPSLRIGRLHTTCARPRSGTGPGAARLDALAADALPTMLAERLGATVGPGVLLVRRLEVGFEMGAGWSDRHLATAWAAHLTAALAEAVSRGDAVRFETREAFLAQYLEDRATRQTGGAWYFSAFQGLATLPASGALRSAILDDPARGRAALATLGLTRRQRVVAALTEPDAARVLAGLAAPSAAPPPPATWESVREASRALAASPGRPEQRALLLFLHMPPPVGVATADRAMVARAWAFLETARVRPNDALFEALTAPSPAALYRQVGTEVAEALLPLRDAHVAGRLPKHSAPGGWLREILPTSDSVAESARRPEARPTSPVDVRETPFGLLFLILSTLDTLPWDAVTRGWRPSSDDSAATLARLAVAAQVAGGSRAASFLADPVVREVLGVSARLTPERWERWARAVRPRQRAAFARAIALHLASEGRLSRTWLWAPVAQPGAPVGIVLDTARGDWLDARGLRTAPAGPLASLIGAASPALRPARLVVPAGRVEAFRAATPEVEVVAVDEADRDPALRETLARGARLAESIKHLALARPWTLPRPLGLALGLAAHAVVRDLAWRIPGFERSSVPYVVRNLLDVPAEVRVEPRNSGEWHVRVGRPPLQILLARTSIPSAMISPSWSPGVRYRLHQ